ncbi:MAG: leucine-rich repeat domain-containing protein, partial [Muribaculaceae bacterium]|nr:leucine-rich repeat domain-containing protein [Muribaculaceae bacterium]
MKKLLLLLLGVLIALPSVARDFTYEYEGQTITYTVIDEETKTCMTKGAYYDNGMIVPNTVSGDLVLPANPKDGNTVFTLVEIGSNTFQNCTELISIVIPNSVTSISYGAFYKCSNLTSIEIPNSVTSIGNSAFRYCSSLTSLTAVDGDTTLAFEKDALKDAPIKTLYMGRDWTYTESAAISTSLISVTIGNQVKSIPNEAFAGSRGLTSVEIPNSVTSIGPWAFAGCGSLTSIEIPNSVISIGDHA